MVLVTVFVSFCMGVPAAAGSFEVNAVNNRSGLQFVLARSNPVLEASAAL